MQNQTHKAKKSLGQNFLKSESALNKIVDAGEVSKEDTVIEIGPGKGALTAKLLEKAGQVIAIEKDLDLVEFLKEKFEKEIASGARGIGASSYEKVSEWPRWDGNPAGVFAWACGYCGSSGGMEPLTSQREITVFHALNAAIFAREILRLFL